MSNGAALPPGSGHPQSPAALRLRMLQRTIGALLAVVVVVGGLFYWLDVRHNRILNQRQERARAHVILRPGEETQDWRLKEGARVEELAQAVQKQDQALEALRTQLEEKWKQQKLEGEAKAKARPPRAPLPPVPSLSDILPPPTLKASSNPPTPAGTLATRGAPAAGKGPAEDTPHLTVPPAPPSPAGTPPAPHPAAAPSPGRLRVITPRAEAKGSQKEQTVGWLPSGSFIHGALLSGVDAGTGTGSGLPYPVLMRLNDPAILPNQSKMDLAECFVIGAAFGDLPSERAYIRTETLSCLRKSGGILTIDGDLKGHVIGEDGKLGLRGRVVAREGTLIARSLLAGFLSGLGQAFRPRITQAPLVLGGAVSTGNEAFKLPPLGDTLEAAGMSGVGRSMDMLAHYYIQQAQKIFPVIEIDAGRQVDVVVLKGMPLKFTVQRATAATPSQEVIE